MQIPLEITFQDVDRSEWSEMFIRRQVQRLERYADHIISCRVNIAQPHRHQHRGRPYYVRVQVTVPPRHVLGAVAEPVDVPTVVELRTVIRRAFKAIEQQLIKLKGRQRGETKVHPEPIALVAKIFPEDGYGFLTTLDGQEIYFHRNAVLRGNFNKLAVGTGVRFEDEEGELGRQASTVLALNPVHERQARQAGRDISLEW